MIEPCLKSQLEPAVRRPRSWVLWKSLTLCWGVGALVGSLFLLFSWMTGVWWPWFLPLVALLGVTAAVALVIRASLWQPDYRQIAREIERRHPHLHDLLLTAVEQNPDPVTGRFHYLQECVIREALQESRRQDWKETVSGRRLTALHATHLVALTGFALVLTTSPSTRTPLAVWLQPQSVTVTPGDTTVEKGHGLVVLARFNGSVPSEGTLVVDEVGGAERRYPMTRSLDDPVFAASIPEISRDLRYRVEYADKQTPLFQVTVFEYPRLDQADATLHFPDYTALPDKQIKDTRRISAVVGTRLDLDLHLNKAVALARLVSRPEQEPVSLNVATNQTIVRLADFILADTRLYDLQLVDHEGRTNKVPAQFHIEVAPNRRPELRWIAPEGDQRLSALEEVALRAETSDDFGVLSYGLHYGVAGGPSQEVAWENPLAGLEKKTFEHLLSLETLGVQVGQVLSWYVWADDIGPDGTVRRSFSDMNFGEIRPFEEIFRENPSQEGSASDDPAQQGGGDTALKLADLQKEIINATWRFIREETDIDPSPHYLTNILVVRDAQQQALTEVQSLQEQAADQEGRESLASVEREMENALEYLTDSVDTPRPLPEALAAEQSAYQALLRLSAREFLVSQSRRGGQRSGGQRSQQQLDQLQLRQAENRYETERQAASLRSQEQEEQSQVLNRLKDLARRQQDLNERLQELQTALQESQTEEERAEIRRRLKRLREEEREMLANLDALRQRMARPENQSRMAEAGQKLDQTRSQLQQASEALDQEAVGQALAAGTRAQRQLQDLRDDFRKQNASLFTDQMRQMRQDARELAQRQEDIRQQLDLLKESRRQTLADAGQTEGLATQLQQQQSSLTNLLGNMRAVSEQAEAAEPLLARQLYDAFRKTSQAQVDHTLELAEELIEGKFPEEAATFERRAREEIQSLKNSVEQAAESVLGDEVEALRLARRELEDLAQQVEQEMELAAANPDPGQGQRQGQGETSAASPSPNQPPPAGGAQASTNPDQSPPAGGAQASANPDQPPPAGGAQASANPNQPPPAGGAQASGNAGQPRSRNFFETDAGSGPGGWEGPLMGSDYANWSDRLRDVEEMVEQPDLRNDVARVRDRARGVRADFKRHGQEPQWDLVRLEIVDPLRAVENQISAELARRQSKEALVPIDRDPVPARYSELVRRYYEKLGND